MSIDALDVVVVPDFGGSARRLFEIRILLFLGSWLEHRGSSRDWPLHVATIGELPEGVRALAERCQAQVSHHAPIETGSERFLNKLRGLEVESRTGRILLLDADTLVLGDLSPALELGDCFSALICPGNRVPLEVFQEIFDLLGVKMPSERVLPLIGQLAHALPRSAMREPFAVPIPPYFNSGVVLVPAASRLREDWERIQHLFFDRFGGRTDVYRHLGRGEQYSLAAAAAILREEGVLYRPLPYALHGLDILYAAGVLTYEETAVYHAKSLFSGGNDGALDPLAEIDRYERVHTERLFAESWGEKLVRRLRGEATPRKALPLVRLCERLRELTQRYVLPSSSAA